MGEIGERPQILTRRRFLGVVAGVAVGVATSKLIDNAEPPNREQPMPKPSIETEKFVEELKRRNKEIGKIDNSKADPKTLAEARRQALFGLITTDTNYALAYLENDPENKQAREKLTFLLKAVIPEEEINQFVEEKVTGLKGEYLYTRADPSGKIIGHIFNEKGKSFALYARDASSDPENLLPPKTPITVDGFKLRNVILANHVAVRPAVKQP